MEQSGYRKISKTNIIATWVCAVILAGLSYRNYGFAAEFFSTAAVMFGTSLLITALYFIPIREALKGGIIVTIVGLATLLASVLQGGSDRNFIASFFVLALATLYFDSRIILGYSSVYLSACVAACIADPAYIDGADHETARVLIKLVIYAAVAVVLYAATKQGERLIIRSTEAAKQIVRNAVTAQSASDSLHQSVENANVSMEEVAGNIGRISDSAVTVKEDMGQMLERVQEMREAVTDSGELLKENLSCTQSLSESYGVVLGGVHDGMQTMGSAREAIKNAADTSFSANEATNSLLEQLRDSVNMAEQIDHSLQEQTAASNALASQLEEVAKVSALLKERIAQA